MKLKALLISSLAVGMVALPALSQPPQTPAKVQPHVTLQGDIVRVVPGDFTFQVPQSWVSWNQSNHNNFHLSRAQIDATKNAIGEWDRPYSEILNAIFPIEQCAVHAGGEGWGKEAVGFGDVQMRVYLGDWSLDAITSKMKKDGAAAAAKRGTKVTFKNTLGSPWQLNALSFDLWYGDYGGTAYVDVYSRRVNKRTVALAFMHMRWPDNKEITAILESFKIGKAKP